MVPMLLLLQLLALLESVRWRWTMLSMTMSAWAASQAGAMVTTSSKFLLHVSTSAFMLLLLRTYATVDPAVLLLR